MKQNEEKKFSIKKIYGGNTQKLTEACGYKTILSYTA